MKPDNFRRIEILHHLIYPFAKCDMAELSDSLQSVPVWGGEFCEFESNPRPQNWESDLMSEALITPGLTPNRTLGWP
jgi:hypothetical protein